MSYEKVLEQLKTQVRRLLDDLILICPEEGDILMVRVFFEQIDNELLMKGFIKWVHPWKEDIKARNERFFLENDHVFGPLPAEKVQYFKGKFKDGTFDDSDKEVLWRYFDVFIMLMDQYRKLK